MIPSAYYWRTWVREHLPMGLGWLVPKRRECPPVEHQWYNHGHGLDACYHCKRLRVRRPL